VIRWLDDDEMAAWRGMVEVNAQLQAQLENDLLSTHGISLGDYGVLVQLSEAEGGRLRMCDLAAALHLSPSGLTRRLDGLVRMGLVERVPSADDRRVILAALTSEGSRALEEAAPDHVAGVRTAFLDHLTAAQVRQLASALDAVRRAWEQQDVEDPS
jgi:DNA-binding MarR family transcriptional regulator